MPEGRYLFFKHTEDGGYYVRFDSDSDWVEDKIAFDAFHGYRSPRETCQDEYKNSTPVSEEEVRRAVGEAA
jgi:hypothetical protein